MLNFGVAPAFLVLSYLSNRPDLPYYDHASTAHTLLFIACGGYMLCAIFRLARYNVLTDRLDGLVARAVKGTSELGMQLDSFADFLNFGIAPAYLVLVYLSGRADMPYHDRDSTAHTLLFVACGGYMLCAVFRLARYNVLSDDQIPTKIFFGFPTTLACRFRRYSPSCCSSARRTPA